MELTNIKFFEHQYKGNFNLKFPLQIYHFNKLLKLKRFALEFFVLLHMLVKLQ